MKMNNLRKKRCANTTEEQKKLLIEFMSSHEQLVNCKFSESFKYSDAKLLWIELAGILNSCNGANKTWKEWRKTWQDMRSRTKCKKSEANKRLNKTGGGECSKEAFTDVEEKILQIVGKISIEGHQGSKESNVQLIQSENIYDLENMDIEFLIDETVQLESNTASIPTASSENVCENTPSVIHNKAKNKRSVASHRLENTIKATNDLADITAKTYKMKEKYYDTKLELKRQYYEEKISLMKKDVEAKDRIAKCLEKIIPAHYNITK